VGENGQPIYSLSNYKGALLVIPITAIIGGLMLVGKKLKRLEKY
jgi:hypothetical protein